MLDAAPIGGAQVLDQLEHLLLRGRRKVSLHVKLPGRFPEPLVDRTHGALPAGALLLLAVQRAPVEVEHFVIEGLRQHIRVALQVVVSEVRPPALHGHLAEHHAERLYGIGLAHDETRLGFELGAREQRWPGEAGREGGQLLARVRVVGQVALAALGTRPVRRGDLGFELDDGTGRLRRIVLGGKLQQALDVRGVPGAQLPVDRLVLQVVVAIRQSQPALRDRHHVAVGILLIRSGAELDRRGEPQLGPLHEAADILVGAGGGDRLESRPGGREPGALNGVGIEVRPIEIAELAYVAAGGRILGQRLQDPAQLLQ